MIEVRLPGPSEVLGEVRTYAVPNETWRLRFEAMAPFTAYGPNYDRRIIETLRDIEQYLRNGHQEDHAEHLYAMCEFWAGIRSERP